MTIAESGFKSAKSKDKKIVASGATLQAAEASTTTSKKMSDTSDAGQSHAPASHLVQQVLTSLVVAGDDVETHFEEEVSEQTIRETQRFVITGVHDPRSDCVISIYEAIADGIISQTQVRAASDVIKLNKI